MKKHFIASLFIALILFPIQGYGVETSAQVPITTDKAGQVLPPQQTSSETANTDGSAKADDAPAQSQGKDEQTQSHKTPQDAQKIFEESLRQMMPLNEEQIQKFRERSNERDKALLPASPDLASRTARVSLEPGQKPVSVFTTANVATSLVFHDATGQPWPITSVTNGGPTFFQVLRPELPDGNLLNVMPLQGYSTSTIVVTLEKRDVPLVIRLEADSVRAPERKADALVLFQLAHHGPKATPPVLKDIRETATSTMLSFLDRVPPEHSTRLKMEPQSDDLTGWEHNGKHYLRTSRMLVWPAWNAVVNGAGNTKCYEVEPTSRIMLSKDGGIQTVRVRRGK